MVQQIHLPPIIFKVAVLQGGGHRQWPPRRPPASSVFLWKLETAGVFCCWSKITARRVQPREQTSMKYSELPLVLQRQQL